MAKNDPYRFSMHEVAVLVDYTDAKPLISAALKDTDAAHPEAYTVNISTDPDTGEKQLMARHDMEGYDEALSEDLYEQLNWRYSDSQEETLLSPKEYLVLQLHRADLHESKIAEELGISVGNVRGKLGRIKKKCLQAQKTLEIGGYSLVEEE